MTMFTFGIHASTWYAFLLVYTEVTLKTLLNELCPVLANWYKIGLQLNIPYTTLDCFKQSYSDQSDLMCEVLKHWLKIAVDPPPSWEAVVTALRSPSVNEKKVAEQLELKYCTPVHCIGEKPNSPTKVENSKGISTYYINCTYRSCLLLRNYRNMEQLLLHL